MCRERGHKWSSSSLLLLEHPQRRHCQRSCPTSLQNKNTQWNGALLIFSANDSFRAFTYGYTCLDVYNKVQACHCNSRRQGTAWLFISNRLNKLRYIHSTESYVARKGKRFLIPYIRTWNGKKRSGQSLRPVAAIRVKAPRTRVFRHRVFLEGVQRTEDRACLLREELGAGGGRGPLFPISCRKVIQTFLIFKNGLNIHLTNYSGNIWLQGEKSFLVRITTVVT